MRAARLSVGGGQVSIGELTNVEKKTIDTSLYGKNLRPVVYVLGDVAGEEESPVYAIQKMGKAIDQLQNRRRAIASSSTTLPCPPRPTDWR